MGPVEVELGRERLASRTGAFQIAGRMREGKGGPAPGRWCCPPAIASRSARTSSPSAAGPSPPSSLADPNVSRNHAEIRPQGDGFVVVDLGSTNGTRVNGVRVAEPRARTTATRSAFGNTHATLRGLLTGLTTRAGRPLRQVRDAVDPVGSAGRCPSNCSPSSSSACWRCSTSSSCGCCGRCGPRSTAPEAWWRPAPARRARKAPATVARKAAGAVQLAVVEPAELKGRTYPLGDELTVGRAAGCQVTLDDTYVSQLHARVFSRDGQLFVEDLGPPTAPTSTGRRSGPDGHAAAATSSRSATPCWSW